jgi:hypothetical protein
MVVSMLPLLMERAGVRRINQIFGFFDSPSPYPAGEGSFRSCLAKRIILKSTIFD